MIPTLCLYGVGAGGLRWGARMAELLTGRDASGVQRLGFIASSGVHAGPAFLNPASPSVLRPELLGADSLELLSH